MAECLQPALVRHLGEDFIIFPTATVAELYADSTRSTPIAGGLNSTCVMPGFLLKSMPCK